MEIIKCKYYRPKQRVESRKNSGIIRSDSDNIYFVLRYRLVSEVDEEVSGEVDESFSRAEGFSMASNKAR